MDVDEPCVVGRARALFRLEKEEAVVEEVLIADGERVSSASLSCASAGSAINSAAIKHLT